MMTSSVAHDFSNLLAATSAGVYLLRKRGPEEALLSGIEEAVERGKALTHRLLSFAKDHEREKRLCSPNDRINELEVLLRETVPARIGLRFRPPPAVVSFRLRPGACDASLIILAVHAQYPTTGGGALRLTTRTRS